jgi:type II secretory pathway component GspD/PulD (secretin)
MPATLTLHSKDAPLTDVAAEVGRQLGVPVVLSPVMKIQRLSLDITGLPLETFMKTIAPQPYVDYVLNGGTQQQLKYVALYLYAYNEKPPALDAAVKGKSQALLVQGTFGDEDNAAQETKPDEPLQVTLEDNRLSIVARKQPLAYVLAEIADKYGIPFELEFETNELVDISFSKYTLEQAISSMTPNVRLYFRTDLQTYATKPLRLVLGSPVKP